MSLLKFYPRALKIKNFVVISDLHLGIESGFSTYGSFLPKIINKKVFEEIVEFNKSNNDILVINGDIKHDFGRDEQEFKDIIYFFKDLKEYWEDIVIVRGNHDNYIKNIANLLNIPVIRRLNLKKFVITHGDKLYWDFMKDRKIFIIGNEHPYLKVNHLGVEIPVYLLNKYLLVTPAFNNFLRGSNIINKDFLSPYLKIIKEKKENLKIFTVEEGKRIYLGDLTF